MKRYIHSDITASIQQLDNGGVLLTDYAGDVVNLLVNKAKPYRICYMDMDDVYLIADAMTYLHEEMIEVAVQDGWLPNTSEFMQKYHETVEDIDANRSVNLVFLPDDALENFGSYTDPYATSEFGYEYPITTGSIFTKGHLVQNFFPRYAPDLYTKLKRYAIDENRVFEDYLW